MIVLNVLESCLVFLVEAMALASIVIFALSVMMATVAAVSAAAIVVQAAVRMACTTYAPPSARLTPQDPEIRLRYLRKLRLIIDEQVFALEGELTRAAVDPRTPAGHAAETRRTPPAERPS